MAGNIICGNETLVNQVVDVIKSADAAAKRRRIFSDAWAWGSSSLVLLFGGGLVAAFALTMGVGKPKGR